MNFEETLKKYNGVIDGELESFFDKKIGEAENSFLKLNYSFIRDFVLNGGKRLRPISLIMAYNAVNSEDENLAYVPCLSVELMHNSTLVHDDVMDEDEFRRGKSTIYAHFKEWFLKNYDEDKGSVLFNNVSSRFAVSNAILCGNMLLSLGYSALAEIDSKKACVVYNKAYNVVNDGQSMDVLASFRSVSEKEYFDMIEKKTAALFVASVEIGAILGNASQDKIDNLTSYALNAATAFQIKDDIIDISSEMKKGHELGSDIKKGKKTLMVIKALELADEKDKKIILDVLGKEDSSLEEINSVIDILNSSGAVEYADKTAKEKIKTAKEYLKKAEISKESFEFFDKLADYMVERGV